MNQYYLESTLIIFDLDGTLYETTDHFDHYAALLKEKVVPEKQGAFMNDYNAMKRGEHPVGIGKAYDVVKDVILTLDPLTLLVSHVQCWDGTKWDNEIVAHEYSQQLIFDFDRLIAIGDGWWLPFVAAKHYGVSNEATYQSYTRTKEYMVTDAFELPKTPGLKEGLQQLRENRSLVLVTNSEEGDVDRLLTELELDGLFQEIISMAQKPVQSREIFLSLMKKYGAKPSQTISVGDNLINDIAPALLIGMKTIYIQPTTIELDHASLKVVPSLSTIFSKL